MVTTGEGWPGVYRHPSLDGMACKTEKSVRWSEESVEWVVMVKSWKGEIGMNSAEGLECQSLEWGLILLSVGTWRTSELAVALSGTWRWFEGNQKGMQTLEISCVGTRDDKSMN